MTRGGLFIREGCWDLLISLSLTSPKKSLWKLMVFLCNYMCYFTCADPFKHIAFWGKLIFSVLKRLIQHLSSKIITKKIIPTLLLFLDICLWLGWLHSPWNPKKTGSVREVKQTRHSNCDDSFRTQRRLCWSSSVSDLPGAMVAVSPWADVIAGLGLPMFTGLFGDYPESFLLHWEWKGALKILFSFFLVGEEG